jgi:hypothetical protein
MGESDIAIWAFATVFPVVLIFLFQKHLNDVFSNIELTIKKMTKIGDHNSAIYLKRIDELQETIKQMQLKIEALAVNIEQERD